MTALGVMSRRGPLRLGFAGIATAGIAVAHSGRAGAAPPVQVSGMPTADGDLCEVYSADGSCILLPERLAFALPNGIAGLGAVDEIRVAYDTAVFTVAPRAICFADGSPLSSDIELIPVIDAGGRSELVVSRVAIPSAPGVVSVILGHLDLPSFPDDLVTGMLPVTIRALAGGATLWAGEVGRPGVPAAPWGVTAGVGWVPHENAGGFRTWCPSLCVMTSVGPGSVPAGTCVRIALDGRAHRDAAIISAVDAEGLDCPGLVSSADVAPYKELTWTAAEEIPGGRTVNIGLACSGHVSALDQVSYEPPVVQVVGAPEVVGQRCTGFESATREDEILTTDDKEAALGV